MKYKDKQTGVFCSLEQIEKEYAEISANCCDEDLAGIETFDKFLKMFYEVD